jgi:hypothetical protein
MAVLVAVTPRRYNALAQRSRRQEVVRMADKESVRKQLYDQIEKNLKNELLGSSELKTLAEAFEIVVDTEHVAPSEGRKLRRS